MSQDHDNEVATIFCDACNQLICSLCVCDGDGQHCGHKVLAPHTACAKIKVSLSSHLLQGFLSVVQG